MCGFAGEFLYRPGSADLDLAVAMARRLSHRGPDEEGSFLSSDGRCAIGFRRLAVIDPAGSHQPMTSADGRLTVAFNGEIYNFRELRQRLAADGAVLRTDGDVEVLLHLYARDGEALLQHIEGMFAIALYDSTAPSLLLARDRLGQKPLWYANLGDRIAFASEAKALLLHPQVSREIDRDALTYYFTMGYIPAPLSAWRAIRKLSPGSVMTVADSPAAPKRYWSPVLVPVPSAKAEQIELVRHSVRRAVASHLVSDVPIGALLSGGLDSSVVVALMAEAAGRTGGVRTFTAGFEHSDFDERPHARLVAARFRTEHTELLVRPDVPDAVNRLVAMYDEPFADSSALPTWLICRAAREHVKVALVGDGGDEAFGGYDRYRALHFAERAGTLRYWAIRIAACCAAPFAPGDERRPLRRLIRLASAMPHPFSEQYFRYRRLFSPDDLARLLAPDFLSRVDPSAPAAWFGHLYEDVDLPDEPTRAQYHDLMTYLPDDLLVKADIASMASSLELRAPFLDHGLVSTGLSLPTSMKLTTRVGKITLREAFSDLLPPEVPRRPKRGFAVPLGAWMRGPMLEPLLDALRGGRVAQQGVLLPEAVAGLVNDHIAGRGDHHHRLWALLVFQRWMDVQGR